ncbi:MAG: hypothetical protein P8J33_09525 [Pirellulaceae bacterium]|nr:hypothetical protein [Pirellulaceae bacterium]
MFFEFFSAKLICAAIACAAIAITAIACAVKAPQLPMVIRIVAVFLFVPATCFFAFGFLASGEPGQPVVIWRTAYGVLWSASMLAIGRLTLASSKVTAGVQD